MTLDRTLDPDQPPGSDRTPAPVSEPAARGEGITKVHGAGDAKVTALDGVDIEIEGGAFTAIMGPSGSGKSTLMHCLAGLDSVDGGRIWIDDIELTALRERELTELRRDRIGFIFQSFNLIPALTALENITLPMAIAGRTPDRAWLNEILVTFGLVDRLRHRPSELSGGQQQRVACARALAGQPEIVFADEPTGNLDSQAGTEVLRLLRRSVDTLEQTVVMVTHDPTAASFADRVVFLADGRVAGELRSPTAEAVLHRMSQGGGKR
ncbi:ABC transporter ATP-binding protein [Kitasatospora sp. NPDC051170]|uniref:ABC transporter ATP-binding protein n=1 Tax=Kitasatospora sp. NPDC051170 TaxID=3364056 RepID=UPI003791230F